MPGPAHQTSGSHLVPEVLMLLPPHRRSSIL
jgi:hypothetical protein